MSEQIQENSDDDQAWSEGWADKDEATNSEPSLEADPEKPVPEPVVDPIENSDVESLKQKLRSAEGRFQKFEEHIDDLKSQISSSAAPEKTPEPDTFLPEGWSQDDWDDFSADYPAQAELMEKQNVQVQRLTDRLDSTEQSLSATEQNRQFHETILKAHPDYDDLLSTNRDQIVGFIESQSNPTLKKAYLNVYENGTADEIINLVSDYKADGRDEGANKIVSRRSVDNALAVPGRSTSPTNVTGRAGMPPEDDFSASWSFFPDDSID